MVAYICYADKRQCSQEILNKRVEAYNEGYGTNHMPIRPRFIKTDMDNFYISKNIKRSLIPIEESNNSCNVA
jgi:hypothetical protein